MMASTPRASSHSASSTVVAEDNTRQAEMEAHHLGPRLLDDPALLIGERCEVRAGQRQCPVYSEFTIVGRQPVVPGKLASGVGFCWHMTEEIDVDRPAGQAAQRLDRL